MSEDKPKIVKPKENPIPKSANQFSFSTSIANLDLWNTTRQSARQAYLSTVAEHLVIDIPSRSEKGGAFDTTVRVQYHSLDIETWDDIEKERSVLFDMARQLQLGIEDYKQYKLPIPKNYTTLYQEYRKKNDEMNDKLCRLLIGKARKDVNLCDQRLLQDALDAYEYKNRTGNVNLPSGDDSDSSTFIS